MKDTPDDYGEQRRRARLEKALHDEHRDGRRRTLWFRVGSGVVLGSFLYLIVSCFHADVTTPKIERAKFNFHHSSWPY